MRAPMPLIVRGGLNGTFGSLAGFTALSLLSLGIYLLADAFAHPVEAEAVGVIVAAFAMRLRCYCSFFSLSREEIRSWLNLVLPRKMSRVERKLFPWRLPIARA